MNRDRLEQIRTSLRDNALNKRKAALDELATIPSETALPILQELAQDRDFGLRRLAVMGMGNQKSDRSFMMLQDILQTEPDPNVLAEAANSLFDFGDRAIAPLQELFVRSDNWLVRQTIIAILADSEKPDILLQVAKLAIADRDQTTKETGILALSRLLNTSLSQQAYELFSVLAEDKYWRTRWRTAIALTASEDIQAKQLLAKLQQDEHYRVVAAALEKPQ